MKELKEIEILNRVTQIVRGYILDEQLFPEIAARGYYSVMNVGADKAIAIDIVEKIILPELGLIEKNED